MMQQRPSLCLLPREDLLGRSRHEERERESMQDNTRKDMKGSINYIFQTLLSRDREWVFEIINILRFGRDLNSRFKQMKVLGFISGGSSRRERWKGPFSSFLPLKPLPLFFPKYCNKTQSSSVLTQSHKTQLQHKTNHRTQTNTTRTSTTTRRQRWRSRTKSLVPLRVPRRTKWQARGVWSWTARSVFSSCWLGFSYRPHRSLQRYLPNLSSPQGTVHRVQ